MIDVNKIWKEAIRETDNHNDTGTLFFNWVSKMNENIKDIEKTSSNQQRYKKINK